MNTFFTRLRRALSLLAILLVTAAQSQTYRPDWQSLDTRPIPQWYEDAKFGIFIHWGLYSVPAFAPTDASVYAKYAEWYWMRWTDPKSEGNREFVAFHNRMFGPETRYQDFVKDFKAEMFDPDEWARIIADAGARYVVLTSKHHDGFALFPSRYSWNWNAMDVGPHRDLAGDLIQAARRRGLRMGYYYSLYEWFNPLYRDDVNAYVDAHMIPQMKELVNAYKPDLVWTDGEWDHPSSVWKSEQFLTWLYNESPVKDEVVVNDRWGKETRSHHGGFYTTEYRQEAAPGVGEEGARHKWEECRGIGGSFGYNRAENLEHYSTSEEVVEMLIDLVSDGGNLLLNIGPTADGRIPVIMQQRLKDVGGWLRVNGEAIYGTQPWAQTPIEKGILRYTTKGKDLYSIALKWPAEGKIVVPVTARPGTVVTLLGHGVPLKYRARWGALEITLPALSVDQTPSQYAHAVKITNVL